MRTKIQKEQEEMLYQSIYQTLKMLQLQIKQKLNPQKLKHTNFHKLQFSLFLKKFSLISNQVFLEEYFQEHKLKVISKLIIQKKSKNTPKSLLKKSILKNRINKYLLLFLLLKLESNFSLVVLFSFFFSPFTIFPMHQWIPKRNNTEKINNPLIINKIPDNKEGVAVPNINADNDPPTNAINPNIMKISGTPYAKIFKNILAIISIHQHFVTSADLKHLWASLSSKETFVFDTPGRDAHLYFSGGSR